MGRRGEEWEEITETLVSKISFQWQSTFQCRVDCTCMIVFRCTFEAWFFWRGAVSSKRGRSTAQSRFRRNNVWKMMLMKTSLTVLSVLSVLQAYELLRVPPLPQLLRQKWTQFGFFYFTLWTLIYILYMSIVTIVIDYRPVRYSPCAASSVVYKTSSPEVNGTGLCFPRVKRYTFVSIPLFMDLLGGPWQLLCLNICQMPCWTHESWLKQEFWRCIRLSI